MSGAERRAGAERDGRRAETLAAWFLRLKGWRIVARRVKTRRGEIDIIARRGRMVSFVEVKWRARGDALGLAFDERRLQRVAAAAETLAARHVGPGDDMRIDVVLMAPGRWPVHLANVWQP